MAMAKHENSGSCQKCLEIIDLYPGFSAELKNWFVGLQKKYLDVHVSCAGRGQVAQEQAFQEKKSDAHWTQSAHNFNAALDLFFLVNEGYCLDEELFQKIHPDLPETIAWYGEPTASYKERPHFELKSWKDMVLAGALKLVE